MGPACFPLESILGLCVLTLLVSALVIPTDLILKWDFTYLYYTWMLYKVY